MMGSQFFPEVVYPSRTIFMPKNQNHLLYVYNYCNHNNILPMNQTPLETTSDVVRVV